MKKYDICLNISYLNDYLYNWAWKCTHRYPICKLILCRTHNILGNNIFLFIDSGYIQICIQRILMKINYLLTKINKSNKNEILFNVFFQVKAVF